MFRIWENKFICSRGGRTRFISSFSNFIL